MDFGILIILDLFSLIWDHWKPKHQSKNYLSILIRYINNSY